MPYDYGALEPFISGEIMKIHHEKHHKAYVTNLNVALEKYADAERKRDVQQLIALQGAIKFNGMSINFPSFFAHLRFGIFVVISPSVHRVILQFIGGGHVNHSIFWTNLASPKNGGGGKPTGELLTAIEKDFGSYEKLVERMTNACIAVQGSGWGWLGYSKDTGRLAIAACPNQDPLLATHNLVPLLGFDVWEVRHISASSIKARINCMSARLLLAIQERQTRLLEGYLECCQLEQRCRSFEGR